MFKTVNGQYSAVIPSYVVSVFGIILVIILAITLIDSASNYNTYTEGDVLQIGNKHLCMLYDTSAQTVAGTMCVSKYMGDKTPDKNIKDEFVYKNSKDGVSSTCRFVYDKNDVIIQCLQGDFE